jgi:DNA gyrase subunit A
MRISEDARGSLVGAFIAQETDELFAIASNGVVLRTQVSEIRATGRDTMGVSMMKVAKGVKVVAVTKAMDVEE